MPRPRSLLLALVTTAAVALPACALPPPPGTSFMSLCPVTGRVSFSDDWHAPRAGGALHEGNDVFAARGTPNVAVVSGVIERRLGSRSGNAVWLYGDDGSHYFYAHFDRWQGENRRVTAGEVIGYTGNTGDASATATHTHFEIHPGGGAAVNPYPSLVGACTSRQRSGTRSSGTEVGTDTVR